MTSWLFHSLAYYLGWITCIYFAGRGYAWLSTLVVLLLIALQIAWQWIFSNPWKAALLYAISLMTVGIIVDTTLMHSRLIVFFANPWGSWLSPPWMAALWLSFGLSIQLLYRRWQSYYWLWTFLALIGLPLAYGMGELAGAAIIQQPFQFYPLFGIVWAVILPVSLLLMQRLQGKPS